MAIFDSQEYAKQLLSAGFTPAQTDILVQNARTIFEKLEDLSAQIHVFRADMREMESRILLKTGAMIAGAVAIQTALIGLLFQFAKLP